MRCDAVRCISFPDLPQPPLQDLSPPARCPLTAEAEAAQNAAAAALAGSLLGLGDGLACEALCEQVRGYTLRVDRILPN